MWQKQQRVGSHRACALLVNLVEWKIWKRSTRVWETKITIIYNLRDVYQTKDIQSRSESWKIVQAWVIEKSFNCALNGSCKNTAENFDRHRRCHGQNYFTITAEIHALSLVKFYCQYADRHMNLYFMRRVSKRERAIKQFVIVKKQIDVSF